MVGNYGEVNKGVRRLVQTSARAVARDRERKADFNCVSADQAVGVVAWHLTRQIGRLGAISSAQAKEHQLLCVAGSHQARRAARGEWGDLPDGLGGAYWFHRRSARDGGGYAGRGFGGFSS